ncbi:MAG: aldose epimerase family protein [Acidimicrobiales bacterium]
MSVSYGMTAGNSRQPPTEVHRHRLVAPSGLAIELLDLGATLARVELPGSNGEPVPVVLDLDSLVDREDPVRNPYLGVSVGRYANRLRGAQFPLDGITRALQANEGDHQLHGGSPGFSHVVWETVDVDDDRVCFGHQSPDGDNGFPGALDVSAAYRLTDHAILVTYEATTDAPTVVSMTNHAYWNLGGPTEEDIGAHVVDIAGDHVVPIDADTLPAGPPVAVDTTPFDLRAPTRLADRLGFSLPNGFDHCFMVEGDGLRRHSTVTHPTGRRLEVWSDHPAVQFYTGAFLSGGAGADGRHHDPFSALCLEPQRVPDAPNLDWAPSAVLRPGERYVHEIEFRLQWEATS